VYRYTGAKLVSVYWSETGIGKLEQIWYEYNGEKFVSVYWSETSIGISYVDIPVSKFKLISHSI